jgi:O-methyltransferase involved in polyketide biosynthesis
LIDARVPVVARWALFALGAVDKRRSTLKPIDPVAAWLLQYHPELAPPAPQAEVLSTVRARTELTDRLLAEELAAAESARRRVVLWSFGCGFDARWFRFSRSRLAAVADYREVDIPPVLELKAKLLGASPFANAWSRVTRTAMEEERWSVQPKRGFRQLVMIESAA